MSNLVSRRRARAMSSRRYHRERLVESSTKPSHDDVDLREPGSVAKEANRIRSVVNGHTVHREHDVAGTKTVLLQSSRVGETADNEFFLAEVAVDATP